jgi:predicted molibdopterin-dependent oxidoreductase YjgC
MRAPASSDNEYVRVSVDGKTVEVPTHTTVAAAMVLAHGIQGTRLSVNGEPRAALCGMGVCQECRVRVDGRAHVLACQTLCRDGMIVCTERSAS